MLAEFVDFRRGGPCVRPCDVVKSESFANMVEARHAVPVQCDGGCWRRLLVFRRGGPCVRPCDVVKSESFANNLVEWKRERYQPTRILAG